jgi:diguanylate cyclase
MKFVTKSLEPDDAFEGYKRRVERMLSFALLVLIIPLSVKNILDGYYLLASGTFAMCATVILRTFVLGKDGRSRMTSLPFVCACLFTMVMVFAIRGTYGMFWAQPLVLYIYFIEQRFRAHIVAAIAVIMSIAAAVYFVDPRTGLRYGLTLGLVVLFVNIFLHLLDSLQERLVSESVSDHLTGAFNRRALDAHLGEAVDRKRRAGTPASMLMLDLDHFKLINDTFGHARGDLVLKDFAGLLKQHSRRIDKVFRIGGEEFLLLLPDTPAGGAMNVASKLLASMAANEFVPGQKLTVSIGLCELADGETPEQWLARGDLALYDAKRLGRNRIEIAASQPLAAG